MNILFSLSFLPFFFLFFFSLSLEQYFYDKNKHDRNEIKYSIPKGPGFGLAKTQNT